MVRYTKHVFMMNTCKSIFRIQPGIQAEIAGGCWVFHRWLAGSLVLHRRFSGLAEVIDWIPLPVGVFRSGRFPKDPQ